MFVRNLLQAGDYVTLVPVGIPITLQYGEKGTLQKVFRNHDVAAREELSNSVMADLLKAKQVPHKISIQGGTTWIEGVLYTEDLITDPGELPECIYDTAIAYHHTDSDRFEFYAGNVESLAQNFNGALAVNQWLQISSFKVLPGFVISAATTEENFLTMIQRDYPFTYPLVSNYIVFRNGQVLHMSTGLSQCIIASVDQVVDESGVIRASVTTTDNLNRIITYSDIVKHHVSKDACIVSASDGRIIFSDSEEVIDTTIICSCCKKKLTIPHDSSTLFKCSDTQCNSVLYPRVKQMLEYFELPGMTYEEYKDYSDKVGTIFSIPDIFDIDMYKEAEIRLPLTQVIRAIIPKSILPGKTQIAQLCDACTNSKDTLLYYLQHADKMKVELGLDVHTFMRLYKWLLSPENVSDVVELLKLPNLEIVASDCKFDGAPIFRDKTIAITGTFKHGSLSDIQAIFESYDAKVVTSYADNIDCVVLGDINENIKGMLVHHAKEQGVPIFSETQFFKQYDIESDMAENLK